MNIKILNPLHWKKSILASILAGFIVVWFSFFDTYSLFTKYQLESQKKELIQKTKDLEVRTNELDEKISNLSDNPDLLEKIAREEYGMRKPGETVYKIEPAD